MSIYFVLFFMGNVENDNIRIKTKYQMGNVLDSF